MFKGSIEDQLDRLRKTPNVYFCDWLDKRFKPFSDKSMMIGQTLYRLNGNPCTNFIDQTPRRFEKRQWRFKKRRLWTVFVSFLKRFRWQKNGRCHCMHKQNPYLKANRKKMAHFKKLLFCQKTFFWHQTSLCKCSMSLYCVGKVLNCFGTSCGTSWIPRICTIYTHVIQNC